MPRKGKSAAANGKTDINASRRYFCPTEAVWGGYVNLRITQEERGDFDLFCEENADELASALETAVIEGLKLGVTYDAENSAYIATFTGSGCVGDRARFVLVARGQSYPEAVALLVYKHFVLLDGDWSSYRPATGGFGFG